MDKQQIIDTVNGEGGYVVIDNESFPNCPHGLFELTSSGMPPVHHVTLSLCCGEETLFQKRGIVPGSVGVGPVAHFNPEKIKQMCDYLIDWMHKEFNGKIKREVYIH